MDWENVGFFGRTGIALDDWLTAIQRRAASWMRQIGLLKPLPPPQVIDVSAHIKVLESGDCGLLELANRKRHAVIANLGE